MHAAPVEKSLGLYALFYLSIGSVVLIGVVWRSLFCFHHVYTGHLVQLASSLVFFYRMFVAQHLWYFITLISRLFPL